MQPDTEPVVVFIQHEAAAGPGLVGARMRHRGIPTTTVHAYAGDPVPSDLDGMLGLVVLGGAVGPCEDDAAPWLPDVRNLLQQAVSRDLPTLGLCLGAELLAVACGGAVTRMVGAPELGLHSLRLTSAGRADLLLSAMSEDAMAVEWHQEEISSLPQDAVSLCETSRCPNQAFRLGDRVWGTQFHPEVLAVDIEPWAAADTDGLARAGRTATDVLDEVRAAEDRLRHEWEALADRWIDLLSPGGPVG
ncbi:type 1 glutamine amidotransferase [Rudaeicoccus suwonensis]|uniref:GMP synthase-like glutamine amidotransferase n=1 Tax=Rudaeicoccus suwonensis TaxID=657409 RepID=A0A561EB50_9MICO|nr:type 1 glutamine amidotransferase [Rudaeicoccus suwonensis]TWE12829.1 GMP synthase-like glutamine amidotransferase [Rudaeicoccus suwonensis]